jgi:hypothetical protein
MDQAELIAQQHLFYQLPGSDRVVHEPDGNITPDFLVDGQIEIEVRRLNEHDWNHDNHRPLEELEIPLVRQIRSLINVNEYPCEKTFGIIMHFGRPLPNKRSIEKGTKRFLDEIRRSSEPQGMRKEVAPRIHLICTGDFVSTGTAFKFLGWWDDNQGGSILPLVERNVRICADNKLKKVRPYKQKYQVWWLLLVDYVSAGANDYERLDFKDALSLSHDFDRVLLVDPLETTRTLEL